MAKAKQSRKIKHAMRATGGLFAKTAISAADLNNLTFTALAPEGDIKPVRVRIADLKIDETYQYHPETEPGRMSDLKKWLAERGGYDEQEAGPIHVSERADGSLYNVDGGGRAKMAELSGLTHILAIVKKGLTWAQEAKLFYDKNSKKRTIKQPHLFIVAAHAGEEPQASILPMIDEFKYALERTTKNRKQAILAPSALLFAFMLGPNILRRSLAIIRNTWGDNVDGRALVSVSTILAAFPKLDEKRLRSKMLSKTEGKITKIINFKDLLGAARVKAAAMFTTRTVQSRDVNPYLMREILSNYNYNLHKEGGGNRLDPLKVEQLRSRFETEAQYKDVWHWENS